MKVRTLLIISAISTLIMMVMMILHGSPLKVDNLTPRGIIDLELAGTVTRATEIYDNWRPDLTALAIKNTWIDFIFLISYGTFLSTCCAILSHSFTGGWYKAGRWLLVLMIVAAAFDAFENVLMFTTLSGHIKKELVASTLIFASIKFILVGFGVLYILVSLVARLLVQKKKMVRFSDSNFHSE